MDEDTYVLDSKYFLKAKKFKILNVLKFRLQ